MRIEKTYSEQTATLQMEKVVNELMVLADEFMASAQRYIDAINTIPIEERKDSRENFECGQRARLELFNAKRVLEHAQEICETFRELDDRKIIDNLMIAEIRLQETNKAVYAYTTL